MASLIKAAKSWFGRKEGYGRNYDYGKSPASPVGYSKKEYYTQPGADRGIWANLPKINPRVLLGGNGGYLIDTEVMTGTAGTWDPRGEIDAVKRIQSVTVPGQLVNDRALTAAQQRAENRDLQGWKPNQI